MKNEDHIFSFPNDETASPKNEDFSRHSLFLPVNSAQKADIPSVINFEDNLDSGRRDNFSTADFIRQKPFTLEDPDKPTLKTWLKHGAYFLLTCLTAMLAGLLPPLGTSIGLPENFVSAGNEYLDLLMFFPLFYATVFREIILAIAANPQILWNGAMFSFALMTILTAHEFGHYIACRLYKVDATLPFFIPTPPLIGPAGTLGAFIKINSPLPSKCAVFDIGVAGPIAGFIALLPFAFIGLATMETVSSANFGDFTFGHPLLTVLIGKIFGINPANGLMNPFYAASWIGLLVTGLNLIPVGQLDGGHAVFAVFGAKFHRIFARVAFVVMCVTAVLGFIFYNSPSGFLFAVLLGFMLRVHHPEPIDNTPLDFKRKVIAFLTLIIFILAFSPFPIQVNF